MNNLESVLGNSLKSCALKSLKLLKISIAVVIVGFSLCRYAQADGASISLLEQGELIKLASDITDCPFEPNKPAEISVSFKEPNYDNSGHLNTDFTLNEIRSLASSYGSFSAEKVVAFADVKFAIAYEFSTRHFKLPNQNTECHWVDHIQFEFIFKQAPTILFPSELYQDRADDGGVCYDQIYAHEMQHVMDYERAFEEAFVTVQQDQRFRPDQSIPNKNQMLAVDLIDDTRKEDGSKKELLAQMLSSYYKPIIKKTVQDIKGEMAYLGSLLDTQEEYERITILCGEMTEYIR